MEQLNLLLSQDGLRTNLEKGDAEKLHLIYECNQSREDIKDVENAFSDLHRKFERAKETLENYQKNEEILIKGDEEMLDKLRNRESKIEKLKEKGQDKLQSSYKDFVNNINKIEVENSRLRAQLRKSEMKVDTLEKDSKQKQIEIDKVNTLCDELIRRM